MKLATTVALAFAISALSANPNWKRVAHTKSTIFNAIITSENNTIEEGDLVGVFVNDECRMVATVKDDGGEYYIAGVINSEKTETAVLKYWDQSEEKAITVDTTVTTIPHGEILRFPIKLKGETVVTESEEQIFGSKLSVYPTVFANDLKICAAEPISSITLIAADGKVVGQDYIGDNTFATYNPANIASGQYTLSVQFLSGNVVNTEVFKK